MKILFLDFDGVLNDQASLLKGIQIVPEKVILIEKVCVATKTSIVISSSWRMLYPLKVLSSALYFAGLARTQVVGATVELEKPNFAIVTRGEEIQHWLTYAEEPVETYAIIDDDYDFIKYQEQYLVKTSFEQGITKEHAEKLLALLS